VQDEKRTFFGLIPLTILTFRFRITRRYRLLHNNYTQVQITAQQLHTGTDYCTTITHRYRLLHYNYTQVQITALQIHTGTDYCTTITHRYRLLHYNYTQVQITAQQLHTGTDYCTTITHRYRLLHNNYTLQILPPASFSETLIPMYNTSRRHITEAINLYSYRHENLKSQTNCASNVSVNVYD
jgi:uncharacterized membrane protein YdfJ with MMPL/SSD domain